MNNKLTRTGQYFIIAGLVFYFVVSVVDIGWNDYLFLLLTIAGCQSLLALSFQFNYGLAGLLSLAQVAFFGLGAYMSALLGTYITTEFFVHLLLQIIVILPIAYLVIRLVIVLNSHAFALATLIFSEFLYLIVVHQPEWLGGANGLYNFPSLTFLTIHIDHQLYLLLIVWTLVATTITLAHALQFGLKYFLWRWLTYDPVGADGLGIPGRSLKIIVFTLGAIIAGIAGMIQGQSLKVISPHLFQLPGMVFCLLSVVLGGKSSPLGTIIAVLFLSFTSEWLRDFEQYHTGLYGLLLILTVILLPNGLLAKRPFKGQMVNNISREQVPKQPIHQDIPATPLRSFLKVQDVTKNYHGIQALAYINFKLESGNILGIIGANGSGKTTLINILSGIEPTHSGTIFWNKKNIKSLSVRQRLHHGIIRNFQSSRTLPEISVLSYLALSFRLVRPHWWRWESLISKKMRLQEDIIDSQKALELLIKWGIQDWGFYQITDITVSQLRLLEILRTSIFMPQLLLLDEPMANLEVKEQVILERYLKEQQEKGCIIIIADHHLNWLLRHAHKILWLHEEYTQQNITYLATPDQILANPLFKDFFPSLRVKDIGYEP